MIRPPSAARARSLAVWAAASLALAAALGWWWQAGRAGRELAEAARRLDAGDPAGVEALLGRAEAGPDRDLADRARVILARAALARGEPAAAVGPLDRVDPAGPHAAEAAFWKGRTLHAAGQLRRAADWFARAIELGDGSAEARRWLAASAYDLGDRSAAVARLEEVVALEPRDARAWRALAALFHENAEPDRALPAYEATLRLDPAQPAVRLELAEVLLEFGRTEDARKQLGRCRGGVPEADRLALEARSHHLDGDAGALAGLLPDALARFPDHPGLLAQAARLDLSAGRADAATAKLGRALAADPHDADAHYLLAQALRQSGRVDEAEAASARAAGLRAALAELSDRGEEADRRPRDPAIRRRLAELCRELGRPDRAEAWDRAALAIEADLAAQGRP